MSGSVEVHEQLACFSSCTKGHRRAARDRGIDEGGDNFSYVGSGVLGESMVDSLGGEGLVEELRQKKFYVVVDKDFDGTIARSGNGEEELSSGGLSIVFSTNKRGSVNVLGLSIVE